jgi:myo-inositol-1(or 4)-monophosphatase
MPKTPKPDPETTDPQLLHLVLGGEMAAIGSHEFANLKAVDFIGAYPNYKAAYDAWKGAAQRTVDNARMRYFIIHAHRLFDPETGREIGHDH